jgi:hypothetical protein
MARTTGLAAAWSAFRSAALAGEMQRVSSMVQFPLLSSGVVDGDATKVQRSAFAQFFQGFLLSPSGETPNDTSVKQFLSSRSCIGDDALNETHDSAQIGSMVFRRFGTTWRLTQVFSASD